jgi:hypothetical protein
MTHRSNHLRTTHAPQAAVRSAASRSVKLREKVLPGALAITSLITVLVLISGPHSAEYGFV